MAVFDFKVSKIQAVLFFGHASFGTNIYMSLARCEELLGSPGCLWYKCILEVNVKHDNE